MTQQMALFDLPTEASAPVDAVRALLLEKVPGCECAANGHHDSYVNLHGLKGCEECVCPGRWKPAEALELQFEVDFDDGCGAWVELESHAWHMVADANVAGSPIVPCASVAAWGAVSSTGYRSMAGKPLEAEPAEGWYVWGMSLAAHHHCEWHAETKKGRKR